MPHILRNDNLEIHLDLPEENYNQSRFDWTGKIVKVLFHDIPVSGVEIMGCEEEIYCGKGFYNEFGIDAPVGFDEVEIGGWFHKIGIGLLLKDSDEYDFFKKYKIRPLSFQVDDKLDAIIIKCVSEKVNGYAYTLKKEIRILNSGFAIKYLLKNSGEKPIITNEYCHNFLAIDGEDMGIDYELRFPFIINPDQLGETTNLEKKVVVSPNGITFNGNPIEQFYFGDLTNSKTVDGNWELVNTKANICIRENTNIETNKVKLWGWGHVISPEIFIDIEVEPGRSMEWMRKFEVFLVK
jgi:hypothetical protein